MTITDRRAAASLSVMVITECEVRGQMAAKLTPQAMRAARALLGLTIQEIAPRIGVSPTTLNAVEKGDAVRASTEAKILAGLERLDVEITNGNGTGARLRLG